MANTAASDHADLVGEVLAKHWRIREPVVRTDLGVSRITWRVGQRYWLSQSEENRSAELIRQALLVQLVQIAPKSFSHVQAQLKLASPVHTVIICSYFAPYVNTGAVPDGVPINLIHECNSANRADLEQQIVTWLDVVIPEIRTAQLATVPAKEDELLLGVILQGMLSHSKIGLNNHCQKETVLNRIRARHLNAAAGERILDENSEKYESTKESACLFLWKDHNDGKQYFLNPKTVPDVKTIVSAIAGSKGNA